MTPYFRWFLGACLFLFAVYALAFVMAIASVARADVTGLTQYACTPDLNEPTPYKLGTLPAGVSSRGDSWIAWTCKAPDGTRKFYGTLFDSAKVPTFLRRYALVKIGLAEMNTLCAELCWPTLTQAEWDYAIARSDEFSKTWFTAQSVTAYKLRQDVDKTSFVAVGTVPVGTKCDPATAIGAYGVVPRASVTPRSRFETLPLIVFAKCA